MTKIIETLNQAWDWVLKWQKKVKDTSQLILWLATVGPILSVFLVHYWKAIDLELVVNLRLLLIGMLVLAACVIGLVGLSFVKEKRIKILEKTLPAEEKPRIIPEEMILQLVWDHSGLGVDGLKRYIPKQERKLIRHHLLILQDEGFTRTDSDLKWHLTLKGEKYVIKHELNTEEHRYPFDNHGRLLD